MDFIEVLRRAGVPEEQLENVASSLKREIPKEFVSKAQYQKKVNLIDALQEKVDDLEAKAESNQDKGFKEKYDTLKNEFDDYKNNLEKEKENVKKVDKIKQELKANGYDKDKIIDLMLKGIDIDKVAVKDDGTMEGFDIKDIDKEFGEFKTNSSIQGNPSANPPGGGNTQIVYTQEKLKTMSASDIAKNYDAIQKDLARQK